MSDEPPDAVRRWLARWHPELLDAFDSAPDAVRAVTEKLTVLEARALALGDGPLADDDDDVRAALVDFLAAVARERRRRLGRAHGPDFWLAYV